MSEAGSVQLRIDSKRSLRRTQAKKPKESQSFDRCQTPKYALDPLLLYIPKNFTIWESACGDGNLVRGLTDSGYKVIATDILTGQNFFRWQPPQWDIQLTNCPYSVKLEWLEHSYILGKPFALLLPVELLGVGKAQRMFERFGIEIVLLSGRVNFQTVNTNFAKSNAWFPTAWYTWGLGIGQPITYGKITKRPDSQLPLFAPGVHPEYILSLSKGLSKGAGREGEE